MGSQPPIEIRLSREEFAPGDTVEGSVIVNRPKPGPVRGVRVTLRGTEETEITRSHGMGKDSHTHTYSECNTIIAEELTLWGGPTVGWFEAAGEAVSSVFKKVDYPELPAGLHEFDFRFRLPARALPSYEGNCVKIRYPIEARVDVPLGGDLTFEGCLPVVAAGSAKIAPRRWAEHQEAKGLLKAFQPDLKLDLLIDKGELRPGSRIEGRMHVENHSRKRIRGVDLSLLAREEARAEGESEETTFATDPGRLNVPDPEADRQDVTFGLEVPEWMVLYDGRFSRVRTWFRARLDIAMATDATIEVPIETE